VHAEERAEKHGEYAGMCLVRLVGGLCSVGYVEGTHQGPVQDHTGSLEML